MVGMEETEVTTSQADSSDADIDDDDDDVDDDDDDDSEWLNAGCEVSQFTNTDVLTTRRVSIFVLFYSPSGQFHQCIYSFSLKIPSVLYFTDKKMRNFRQ